LSSWSSQERQLLRRHNKAPHSDPESAQSDANAALDPEQDFLARLFVAKEGETDRLQRQEKDFISQIEKLLLSGEVGGLVPRMSGLSRQKPGDPQGFCLC